MPRLTRLLAMTRLTSLTWLTGMPAGPSPVPLLEFVTADGVYFLTTDGVYFGVPA